MCYLKRHLKRPKKGYKVVVAMGDKKLSPATGIIYNDGKEVTPIKVQRRLADMYSNKILDPKAGHGFNKNMIGRTAVFKHLNNALGLKDRLELYSPDLQYEIYEATVSVDVMSGTSSKYGTIPVYAGRVLTFEQRVV